MHLLLFFLLLKSCFLSNNELKPIQGNEFLILSLESAKRDVVKKHLIVKKSNYCNKKIFEKLKYDFANNKTTYYEVNFINSKDDEPLQLKLYDDELSVLESCCFSKLSDYISFMDNASLNIYMLEREANKYLLLIGQNAGATGIGVNYKNYFIVDLSSSQILEIESISDNPLNVYLDAEGLINVIILDEDWEETQNHTRVNLKYYPVIYRKDTFNMKSSEKFVGRENKLKCYNLKRKSN